MLSEIVNRLEQTVSELRADELRTDSSPAANMRLKERRTSFLK